MNGATRVAWNRSFPLFKAFEAVPSFFNIVPFWNRADKKKNSLC